MKKKINISEIPHCNDLESIGSVFMPIVKGIISSDDLVEIDLILKWQDVIGEEIATFCNPIKASFNPKTNIRTLNVEVPVGGFALELQHREQYILDKINAYFGYKAVQKLTIHQNANMKIKKQKIYKVKHEELTENDKNYLLEASSGINDEKLKEILIKLGENVLSANKRKV